MEDQELRRRLGRNASSVVNRFAESEVRDRFLSALEPLLP